MIIDKIRIFIKEYIGVKWYESTIFLLKNRYWPDLTNPHTFNEKISAKKIFSNDDRIILFSDKLKVRDFVCDKIGDEYLTDLYSIYSDATQFKLSELPEQFVLKANHASGSDFIKIVTSKKNVDEVEVRSWIAWVLEQDYGNKTNEWWYQKIEPRTVIAEELLNPEGEDLKDYKFFINSDEIELIQVDQDRFSDHKRNLYNSDWKSLNVKYKYPLGRIEDKPKAYSEMKEVALKLGEEFEFSRIDLYLTEGGKIVFGEITFAPEAGWGRFKPYKFDEELGKKILL